MPVEILIDRSDGTMVVAQEQPCEWGRMEDYAKHVKHFGDDKLWENIFIILVLSDVDIATAKVWVAPQVLESVPHIDPLDFNITEMVTKIASSTKKSKTEAGLRDINTATFDNDKKVESTLAGIDLLIEDTKPLKKAK
jgi:hypothetical protein